MPPHGPRNIVTPTQYLAEMQGGIGGRHVVLESGADRVGPLQVGDRCVVVAKRDIDEGAVVEGQLQIVVSPLLVEAGDGGRQRWQRFPVLSTHHQ